MNIAKTIFVIISVLIFSTATTSFDQIGGDINSEITKAISSGDADKLAEYFAGNIDLTLLSKDGSYSRSQAKLIIKDFFARYPVSSYSVKQTGRSAEGSTFTIGEYISGSKKFRVYYHVRKTGGTAVIQILEFDGD